MGWSLGVMCTGFVDGLPGARAGPCGSQRRYRFADRVCRLRDLGHPERDALAGGHVGLLRGAEIGKRVGHFAGVKIECAAVRTESGELLFGTDDEDGSGADCDPRHHAAE